MIAPAFAAAARTTLGITMICLGIGCDMDRSDPAGGDSTSFGDSAGTKLERGVNDVGEKLGEAAAGLKSRLAESRVQVVIDNIKGMEGVEATQTDDGTINLVGTVASEDVRREAEDLVKRIKGVGAVHNALQVAGGGGGDTSTGFGSAGNPGGSAAPGDTVGKW